MPKLRFKTNEKNIYIVFIITLIQNPILLYIEHFFTIYAFNNSSLNTFLKYFLFVVKQVKR